MLSTPSGISISDNPLHKLNAFLSILLSVEGNLIVFNWVYPENLFSEILVIPSDNTMFSNR